MASFEAGINQYLHPPIELKQANIKAEMIHIGTDEIIVRFMNLIHDSQKKSLRKAIADGESDWVEFKAGFDRETIQSLAAFANTR